MSRVSITAIVALLAAWAVACGGETPADPDPAGQSEMTGVVLDVVADSLTEIETMSVQDDEGVTWNFRAEGYRGWLPSHVRDHMVQGSPITVTYHEEDGVLMVDEIDDATGWGLDGAEKGCAEGRSPSAGSVRVPLTYILFSLF